MLLKNLKTENERHFQALVTSIPGAVYRFKLENDWIITFLSADILEISGYPVSDFVNGSIDKLIDIVHPEDHYNLRRIVSKAVEKKESYTMDYRIIHSDGSIRWVNEKGQGVIGNTGELKFLEGVIFDITQRKQDETQLIAAKNEAEMANRAKTKFLANMSHELRTPLNGILGYAQILQRSEKIPSDQKQHVNIILQSGEYLLTLIDDLLDLSKIESDALELKIQDFSIINLLWDITKIFSLRAKEKGIHFLFEAEDLPKTVCGDKKRLKQILINLLSNALKFTDQGEVWLKVRYYNNVFDFEVGDTGCGIKKNDLNTIFSPFQQVKQNEHSIEGSGLGLSICRNLVNIMHGQLEMQSVQGKGSIFNVRLNIPPKPENRSAPKKPSEYISTSFTEPLNILIVDDNTNNLMMLSKLLSSAGFEASTATSGPECLDKARKSKPNVVLMDIIMPEMDGLETTRRLRGAEFDENMIIIALSANAFIHDKEESLAAGCNDFISKPIHLEELFTCFHKHVSLRNQPRLEQRTEFINEISEDSGLALGSILVADDNEINRMLLIAQLKDSAADITEAKDGIDTLIMMRQQTFDLILLDLHMPGLGGTEIMRYLKDNPTVENQHTPVIAMTAYASDDELSALSDAGFSDYLIKPISQKQLNKVAKQWLNVIDENSLS